MDKPMVAAVKQSSLLSSVHKVHNFHGLVFFYQHAIPNFITIMAPITNCMKARKFSWTVEVTSGFELIK